MNPTSNFDGIVRDAGSAMRPLLERAYEAGRSVGRDEVRAELAELLGVKQETAQPHTATPQRRKPRRYQSGRRGPGTVRPKIKAALKEANAPLSASEVARRTGLNPETVRTTLHKMKPDIAQQIGKDWVLAGYQGPEMKAPDARTSGASAVHHGDGNGTPSSSANGAVGFPGAIPAQPGE